MTKIQTQYEDLLLHVFDNGVATDDRTGTGTRSVFGHQMRFDLSEGFPLVTTKFVPMRLVVAELLWMLSGNTSIKLLVEQDCHIWDEWADSNGDLGPVYGEMWRSWPASSGGGIDQISSVMQSIRHNPKSRRHIVSAWNPECLPQESMSPQENVAMGLQALAPCHALFQFYVSGGKLSCQLYQRSADLFLGVPFNIASYALLTHLVARECGLQVGDFIWTGGDCHIYNNHMGQVCEQLTRQPFPLPSLYIDSSRADDIFSYKTGDITVLSYQHHPSIKGVISK